MTNDYTLVIVLGGLLLLSLLVWLPVIRRRFFPNEFQDVLDFHRKFGMLTPSVPSHLTKRKALERILFMEEELNEFADAVKRQDLPDMTDALVDLVYVAMGTAVQLGIPWHVCWAEVHRANMSKVRGTTKRGNLVDAAKPDGWVAPNHLRILEAYGYIWEDWANPMGFVDERVCLDDSVPEPEEKAA